MRTTTTALAVAAATLVTSPTAAHARSDLEVPRTGDLSTAQMRAHRTELTRHRLARTASKLAHRVAHRRGEGLSPRAYRRRIVDESPRRLSGRVRTLRRQLHFVGASPALEAIAACESGGNPGTDTGNGFYGKYQFTLQTWASVGGSGNPADASESEQNARASVLYAREGSSPWPVCGR